MTRLRWWLARRLAPDPIMRDPYPGEDGVVIVMRQGSVSSFVRASSFQLEMSHHLEPPVYGTQSAHQRYEPTPVDGRFTGTVAS